MNRLDVVTSATFKAEVLDSTVPVLVAFHKKGTPPVKVRQISENFPDTQLVGVKVEFYENSAVATAHSIANDKTYALFKNGTKVHSWDGTSGIDVAARTAEITELLK